MKLVVTGALGHIGSRFIHGLEPGDYDEVVLLDNLSTQRYCSLFNLPPGVPFRFVRDDVCTANLERHFEGMDVVVHLAAITNAAGSFEIQRDVERVNFEGTERVARACTRTGSRLVFVSTTSVYGSQSDVVDEDCPIEDLKPQSPYAHSKLRAEQMLQALARSGGLRCFIGRFGTIFGTSIGMRFHTAVNKFCWQACVGQPLTVWRTALNQKRPYLDVGDAVRALDLVIRRDLFDNRIYNVLTENATVGQIVEIIRSLVPDIVVEEVDSRIMNQLSYDVSSARFEQAGFRAQGRLADGIERTIRQMAGVRQVAGTGSPAC